MSNTNTGSVDASTLSKSDLLDLVNQLQAVQAKERALAGVKIEFSEGVSKAGKAYRNLSVSGGDLGWPGFNLKPKKWARLKALTEAIDTAMEENRHRFQPGE